MHSNQPITLFLFAHQDDEVAFFFEIERALKSGGKVVCAYLTNGEWKNIRAHTRNRESLRVLKHLGVKSENIFFLGDKTQIRSGQLPQKASAANLELVKLVDQLGHVTRIVTFAYEGGHEDHDATFWLASLLAQRNKLDQVSQCVPFYRASDSKLLPFTAFEPLSANGDVQKSKLPWRLRLKYSLLCLLYPSQIVTFIGLAPFLLRQYIIRGQQFIQPMDPDRIKNTPHTKILYEERNRYSYIRFKKELNNQI